MEINIKDGYKVTEVGVIPDDWEVKKLESVSTLSSGTTPSRQLQDRYFSKGTINWVKTTDLNNSNITQTEEKITELAIHETCLKEYDINTVLVAMYGGFNQIGRTGLLKIPATVNQALIAIQSKINILNPVFLINYLNFRVSYWKNVAISSRKDPNITSRDVKNFLVTLPPLAEQKAIAHALSDVDNLITAIDQLITKKRNIKQGTMQELLTGKKRLPGFSGKWEVKRQKEVVKYINGRAYSRSEWEATGTPVIRLQNLTGTGEEYYYSNLKLPDRQYIDYGDLIFMWSASFGPFIWKGKKSIYHYHIWKVECNETEVDRNFYYYKLEEITETLKNGTNGSTMLHITKGNMEHYQVTIPSLPEQKAIAEILTDIDKEIEALEKKRDKYKTIKQGMMQELLTGKTRIIDN